MTSSNRNIYLENIPFEDIACKRGETHIAGTHFLDEATGVYNIPRLHKHLPNTPLQVAMTSTR